MKGPPYEGESSPTKWSVCMWDRKLAKEGLEEPSLRRNLSIRMRGNSGTRPSKVDMVGSFHLSPGIRGEVRFFGRVISEDEVMMGMSCQ